MGYINDKGEYIRTSINEPPSQTPPPSGNGCGCLVIILIIVGLLGYCSNSQQLPSPSSQSPINLTFRSSCGSSLGSGSTWYAVVGDKRAYNTVRNQYCGDSFIRPDGLLQVASFTSSGEAEKFANELSQTTGLSFYVKY
ncbi:MAG: hypothetical protein EWV91_00725 [Microcystis aeruginosa Ma_QC_Ca_00000000_S207]|uniref:Uncharacterized protein n=1 Tax=Microcystis aeruginosa Ma_QC_Ca_00000000_S207 TaxID=2486251 RepID=A0A552G4V5_MICAE|nr:MAG: hypothetical protein EWV91_00725 [Microcystis aeruginosa Ma_QC_Ca_00000000_S207]